MSPSPKAATEGNGRTVGGAPAKIERRGFIGMTLMLLSFSFGPALSKRITTPPLVTVFYRMWIAIVLHWVVASIIKQRPDWALMRRTVLPGVMFGANIVMFFFALQHASVANVTLISSLQPVAVLVVAGPLFGERVTKWDVSWTVVALGGAVVAVLGSNSHHAGIHTSTLGVVLSLGVLLTFTSYFLISKRVTRIQSDKSTIHPITYMTGVLTTGAITITPVCLIAGHPRQLAHLTRSSVFAILLLILVTGGGHLFMSWTHRYVPVSISTLALLVQPITAALVAWPINGQQVVVQQGIGAVIVLAAIGAVVTRRAA